MRIILKVRFIYYIYIYIYIRRVYINYLCYSLCSSQNNNGKIKLSSNALKQNKKREKIVFFCMKTFSHKEDKNRIFHSLSFLTNIYLNFLLVDYD